MKPAATTTVGYRVVQRSTDPGLCTRCQHREGPACRALGLRFIGATECAAYQPRRGRPPKVAAYTTPF